MNIVDVCKANYGRTWTLEMIKALVVKGKITKENYKEVTGETYK